MSVHGVGQGNTNPVDDFEIFNQPEVQNQPQARPNEMQDDVEVIGADLVNGAQALRGAAPVDLDHEIRVRVPARHSAGKSFNNVIHLLGRALMKACHAVYNFFTIAPTHLRSSREEINRIVLGRNTAAASCRKTLEAAQINAETAVTYTPERIGRAMGLRGNIQVRGFRPEERDAIANCNFSIRDIEQDPNLQNCWFLSSLTSFLAAKGRQGLADIITIPDPPHQDSNFPGVDMAFVKLGHETYKVPLADIRGQDGSESGVSSSKAWVRLLETAMQMHMLRLNEMDVRVDGSGVTSKIDMNENRPPFALNALLGALMREDQLMGFVYIQSKVDFLRAETMRASPLTDTTDKIITALNANRTVVLGSPGSMTASLKYGISPGHAVSVQDVVTVNDKRYLVVVDPYNRSVMLDADILLQPGAALTIELPAQQ